MTDVISTVPDQKSLLRVVGSTGIFIVAFGSMLGSAWIVVIGQWLGLAGPVGAMIGIILGGIGVAVIALSYSELMSRMPVAGGEIVYTFEALGPNAAFFLAWLTILPVISNIAFEAIAASWMFGSIFPSFGNGVLYHLFGHGVTVAELTVGAVVTAVITFQSYRGTKNAVRFQGLLTAVFFVIALVALCSGALMGDTSNLFPLLSQGAQSWWMGALYVFSTGVIWFSGFQSVPQIIEERASGVTFRTVTLAVVAAIVLAAGFYVFALLAVSMAKPWASLVHEDMATVSALGSLPAGRILVWAVLVAGVIATVKLWNGGFMMAARVCLMMARAGFLPAALARVHPRYRTPSTAILAIAVLNLLGVAMGPGAIFPLLQTASICITVSYSMAIIDLMIIRVRHNEPTAPYPVPGGWATIVAGFIACCAFLGAQLTVLWLEIGGPAPYEWSVLACWMAIGAVYFLVKRRGVAVRSASETRRALFEIEPVL